MDKSNNNSRLYTVLVSQNSIEVQHTRMIQQQYAETVNVIAIIEPWTKMNRHKKKMAILISEKRKKFVKHRGFQVVNLFKIFGYTYQLRLEPNI